MIKIPLNKDGNLDLRKALIKASQLGFTRIFLESGLNLTTNFLNENSIILPDFPPYIFTIKTLTKTKINIDNDSIITNKVVTPGEDLSFDVKNEIRFDFWDTTHIQCYLNGTSLSNFFGNKNQSIRGSFEINTQRLYYKIYNQINY